MKVSSVKKLTFFIWSNHVTFRLYFLPIAMLGSIVLYCGAIFFQNVKQEKN